MQTNINISAFTILQQQEVNGAALYRQIAKFTKNEKERETLLAIALDEDRHAAIFEKYTGKKLSHNRWKLFWYGLATRLLGYTFVIKLLEKGEEAAVKVYGKDVSQIPELPNILNDEETHEEQLLGMLDEERLHYVGDMVLGMNDALVELTGALAGYTLAMQNTHVIAMAGLITGVSATLSMAASNFLSSREDGQNNALKSATYTGVAYLITVALLIFPFLISPVDGFMWALAITMLIAILIIAGFNYYIAVAKGRAFRKNFLVMAGISLTVAAISFTVGLLVKNVIGIDL